MGVNPHGDYNPWESVKISPFAYQEYIFGENPYMTRWRAPQRKGCYNKYGSGYRQAHQQYRRYVNRGNPKNAPYYGGAYAPYVEGPFGYGYQDYQNPKNFYNYQSQTRYNNRRPRNYQNTQYKAAAPTNSYDRPAYKSAPRPAYENEYNSQPSYNAYQ